MMTTRLLLARHGNTFRPGETPLRVGARTDLPLIESELGTALGRYLKESNWIPDRVLAAPLRRTMQTAELAIHALGLDQRPEPDDRLIEIDYGPDEGQPEADVVARVGEEAMNRWDQDAIPPAGWHVNPAHIIDMWMNIGAEATRKYEGKTLLIVTSNGILRFAPHLCGDFQRFADDHEIKVSTGGLCVLEKPFRARHWSVTHWGLKPKRLLRRS